MVDPGRLGGRWAMLIRARSRNSGHPVAGGDRVCDAVPGAGVLRVQMKWPNDIWIDGRKCAGILVEARPQDGTGRGRGRSQPSPVKTTVPEELRGRATSLGGGVTFAEAVAALNEHVGRSIDRPVEETPAAFCRPGLRPAGQLGRRTGHRRRNRSPWQPKLVESTAAVMTPNAGEVHLASRLIAA